MNNNRPLKRSTSLSLSEYKRIFIHNLKEPFRTISTLGGFLKSTTKDRLTDSELGHLDYIIQCSKRHFSLISVLNDIYGTASQQTELSSIDPSYIIAEVLRDFYFKIEETKAKITIRDLPWIKGNEVMIYQLFYNLIDNALKYNKPGLPPQIEISAKQDREFVLFSISDQGIGIEEDNLLNVFNLFRRADNTEGGRGTGVGLAVCKEIVDLHGGEIWIESIVGTGSTLFLKIPNQSLKI